MPDVPTSELFCRQMTWLAKYCNVLPLVDAVRKLDAGDLPARAACITFDDGYANNLELAAPILRRLGLPATFFIAGGAVDRGIMWNDLAIEALRHSGLTLDLCGEGFGRFDLRSTELRQEAIKRLTDALKYRPLAERFAVASRIFESTAEASPPRLMMTRAQVAELARQGFEIGAHTLDHPILATLDASEARAQIAGSRDWVARVTGRAPESFAYPNGRPGRDYRPEHVDMVTEAGFELAVSTSWGCALRGSGTLELPRFSPWERTEHAFYLRLMKTVVRSYGFAS